MPSATNQDAYGSSRWGQGPWGNPQPAPGSNPTWDAPQWGGRQWGGPPFWHPAGMSRPVAIAFTVLGFIFWWPVGLAILFYMLGTGRMGSFGRRVRRELNQSQNAPWANWASWCSTGNARPASSGNHAFDDYKAATLRRLEEEQQEFGSFLERLRFAKDKAEFDEFMAERRNRPATPPTTDQPAG